MPSDKPSHYVTDKLGVLYCQCWTNFNSFDTTLSLSVSVYFKWLSSEHFAKRQSNCWKSQRKNYTPLASINTSRLGTMAVALCVVYLFGNIRNSTRSLLSELKDEKDDEKKKANFTLVLCCFSSLAKELSTRYGSDKVEEAKRYIERKRQQWKKTGVKLNRGATCLATTTTVTETEQPRKRLRKNGEAKKKKKKKIYIIIRQTREQKWENDDMLRY